MLQTTQTSIQPCTLIKHIKALKMVMIILIIVWKRQNMANQETVRYSSIKIKIHNYSVYSLTSALVHFFAKFCIKFFPFSSFFSFLHKKLCKSCLRQAFWVRRTQTLFVIYNKCWNSVFTGLITGFSKSVSSFYRVITDKLLFQTTLSLFFWQSLKRISWRRFFW